DRRRPREHDKARTHRACHGLREALVKPPVQRVALSRAEPAEPLDRRDLELRHDLVALARADSGKRREELRHPQCAGCGPVVRLGPPQDLLWRDHSRAQIALDARPRTARRNGFARCGETINLGWPYDLTHWRSCSWPSLPRLSPAARAARAWSSTTRSIMPDPAVRMLRLSLTITAGAISPKMRGASSGRAPW